MSGFGQNESEEVKPGDISFHPMSADEYRVPRLFGGMQLQQTLQIRPKHKTYLCGSCGKSTNGRVLCDMKRGSDGATILWCVCSCEAREPSVVFEKDGAVFKQVPVAKSFHSAADWPTDLAQLYDEAAAALAAGAYTTTSMACRKLLMAAACEKGAAEGLKFVQYVDHLIDKVLLYPDAKASISKMKDIGNEANHKIRFVTQPDAERSMRIVTYMLNTMYSFPNA